MSRYLVLLPLVLLAAGCATKRDHYDVPAIMLPGKFHEAPKPQAKNKTKATAAKSQASAVSAGASDKAPQSGAGTPLPQVLPDWWKLLHSAELDSLVERALIHNDDLKIANSRLAGALARAGQADAGRYPVVTAPLKAEADSQATTATSQASKQTYSYQTVQIGLNATWRPDIWGEEQSLYESAGMQVRRAAFQRDDTQRRLIADVAATYIDYLSYNDRLRVAHETEQALGHMLNSMQLRLDKGDATITELEQQRAAVYAVQATIPQLTQKREEAISKLASLLETVPGTLHLSNKGLDSLAYPMVRPGIPSALLLRRPDVRAVEARLLAADADIDVARARVLPPVDLTAQVGYGSFYWSNVMRTDTVFWSAIASLTATIFDKGRREQEVKFARSVHQEMTETYVRIVYNAVREVDDSLSAIQTSGDRLHAQRKSTESARRAWQYSIESYDAGAIDYLALLDTERTYHRNLDLLHSIRMDHYRALVSLFSALGGGVKPAPSLPGKGRRPELPHGGDTGYVQASDKAQQDNEVTDATPQLVAEETVALQEPAKPATAKTTAAVVSAAKRESRPPPLASAPAVTDAGGIGYAVQLATFSTPQAAADISGKWHARGYDTYLYLHRSGKAKQGVYYTVRYGNYASRAQAVAQAARISAKENITAVSVPVDLDSAGKPRIYHPGGGH